MPVFEFAGFRLDSVKRRLILNGHPVNLAPRAIDVLGALVARTGETVDKDEMMRAAWGATIVEENTLARNILLIRKALGETGDNKFILTVSGRGYRFVCPVTVQTEQQPLPARSHSRRRTGAALAVGLVLIAAGGYAYRKRSVSSARPPFLTIVTEHATKNGNVLKVALSPDGRTLIFAAGASKRHSLHTRDLVTGEERELVTPGGLLVMGITPSADGSSVYFVARGGSETTGTLYRIALTGGETEKLIANVESPVSFAPDGKIVFARQDEARGDSRLIVSRPDGSQARTLASVSLPRYLDYPEWSPDGKHIVATRIGNPANRLLLFDAETGGSRDLGGTWGWVSYPRWMPDGRHLLVAARAAGARSRQLWSVALPGGEASPVTRDLDDYYDASLSRDGRSLIALNRRMVTSLWAGPASDLGAARHVVSGLGDESEVVWTPDARLVFSLQAQARGELWRMSPDGSEKTRWQMPGSNYLPSVCRDTGSIVFVRAESSGAATTIWMADGEGRNMRRITPPGWWHNPQCSPDGAWITYVDLAKPGWPLMRRQLESGSEMVLSGERTAVGAISPDGAWVAQLAERPRRIRIMPANGGEPLRSFSLAASAELLPTPIRWTPDGKGVAYVDRARGGNVWVQSVDGGPPRQYTNLQQETVLFFDWSRDGKQFASIRLLSVQEAVRIREPQTR